MKLSLVKAEESFNEKILPQISEIHPERIEAIKAGFLMGFCLGETEGVKTAAEIVKIK